MSVVEIKQLFIYPVKSLGGVEVDSIRFCTLGPVDDRRYMLINHQKRFITQRSHAILSQFKLKKVSDGWQVRAPDGTTVVIENDATTDNTYETQVWKTPLNTREKSRDVSNWFGEHLNEWVRLVEFDDLETRYCCSDHHQVPFAFADAYPLLVCNEQSLAVLSNAVQYPMHMLRFRPNIVISVEAGAEYEIQALAKESEPEKQIQFIEPCERCNVPSIDPLTGVFQKDLHDKIKQRLKQGGPPIFGMNALTLNLNKIRVGDRFTCLN